MGAWAHHRKNRRQAQEEKQKAALIDLLQEIGESVLGGGFKHFFIFTPIWGKIPISTSIFRMGCNHQPVDVIESSADKALKHSD